MNVSISLYVLSCCVLRIAQGRRKCFCWGGPSAQRARTLTKKARILIHPFRSYKLVVCVFNWFCDSNVDKNFFFFIEMHVLVTVNTGKLVMDKFSLHNIWFVDAISTRAT